MLLINYLYVYLYISPSFHTNQFLQKLLSTDINTTSPSQLPPTPTPALFCLYQSSSFSCPSIHHLHHRRCGWLTVAGWQRLPWPKLNILVAPSSPRPLWDISLNHALDKLFYTLFLFKRIILPHTIPSYLTPPQPSPPTKSPSPSPPDDKKTLH